MLTVAKHIAARTPDWAPALREFRGPLLLVVENDLNARRSLAKSLQQRGYRVALARSVGEALEMLDDLRFIESDVDGLIVEYRLPDGLGCRIVQDFQREFPDAPAALVLDEDDIAMQLWTRARGISLVNKSALPGQIEPWLTRVQVQSRAIAAEVSFQISA